MLSSNWCWLPRWDELPQLLWDQGVGSHTHWSQRLPSPGEVVFDPVVMHGWLPGGEHEFWLDAQCVLGNWSWSFCQWSENTGWKGGLQLHWLDRFGWHSVSCWTTHPWKVQSSQDSHLLILESCKNIFHEHVCSCLSEVSYKTPQYRSSSDFLFNMDLKPYPWKNAWGSRCRKNRIFVSKHWEGMKTTQSCPPSSKLPTSRFYCGGWPGSHSVVQIVTQTYLAKTYLCW